MNQVINFYKRSGKKASKILDSLQHGPIFKGIKPPLTQTPGRAQVYYPESLHLVPESILYKVRLPSKLAGLEDSKKYEDIVQEKTLEYLQNRFTHNLFDPAKGFHLDLTISEIRQLHQASQSNFSKAESGDLQTIIDSERELRQQTEQLVTEIEDTLEDVEDKISAYENQTAKLIAENIKDSTHGLADLVPFVGRDYIDIAIEDVGAALSQDSSNEAITEISHRLHAIAHAKHQVAHIRLDLVNCWNEHHANETYDQYNFEDASSNHDSALELFNKVPSSWKGDATTFGSTLEGLTQDQVPQYLELSTKFERFSSSKESFFSTFTHDDVYDQTPDQFKQDLIAYLSSTIVVKEHRLRYQAEQYERYLTAARWIPVHEHMTLRDFSESYAAHIRREVEVSYNFISPKIAANYDDYQERRVNPINSAVFYYFFNANRTRRKLAQGILSAARYPNEKIRRAYLRFFNSA